MEVKNSTITITCCSSDEPDSALQDDVSVYCCCIPVKKTSKETPCDTEGTVDVEREENNRPAECPTTTPPMTQN